MRNILKTILCLFTVCILNITLLFGNSDPKWIKDTTGGGNLIVTEPETWTATVDEFGSKFKGDPLIKNKELKVDFTIAIKKGKNDWPFVLVGNSFEKGPVGTKGIKVTYKCSVPLIVRFAQSDFGDEGDKSHAHYESKLPPSNEYTTAYITVNQFKQPDWAPAATKKVKLNLSNVDQLLLLPDLDYTLGNSTTLFVKEVELYK